MANPVTWNDSIFTWNSTTGFWDDTLPIAIQCAVSSLPIFPEVYPNRVPEDIFDSLYGELMPVWNSISATDTWDSLSDVWGTTGFIFSQFGPTLNH